MTSNSLTHFCSAIAHVSELNFHVVIAHWTGTQAKDAIPAACKELNSPRKSTLAVLKRNSTSIIMMGILM